MPVETIERDFRTRVCEKVSLASEGVDRYRVFTPFRFEDGDHLDVEHELLAGIECSEPATLQRPMC